MIAPDADQAAIEDVFRDLVTAILCVNGWNLDKVAPVIEELQRSGLSPRSMAVLTVYDLAAALEKAGLNRGEFIIGLLAGRVHNAAKFMAEEANACLVIRLDCSDCVPELQTALKQIRGVGPRVMETYLRLRGLVQSS